MSLLKTMIVRLLLSKEREVLLDAILHMQNNQDYCLGIAEAYEVVFKEDLDDWTQPIAVVPSA